MLIIYSEEPMVDYSVVFNTESSLLYIYCCTTKGKFYKVSLLNVQEEICSRSNSIRSSGDQDVFSDLLDDSVADGIELCVSTKPVYKLKTCDLVYNFEKNTGGLCVAYGFVVVMCKTDLTLEVQIYREKDFCKIGSIIEPVRVIEIDNICYSENRLYSKHIPVKCLTSAKIISTSSQSSDSVSISTSLFKTIVGQDVCLLNSPAVVISPPGGSVYFAPFKDLKMASSMGIVAADSKSALEQKSISGFKILCETTSEVALFDVMSVKTYAQGTENSAKDVTEMLVTCCQNGLVSLMADFSIHKVLQVLSFSVDSPVRCVCCFRDKLYHSTGRYVCETTVSLTDLSLKMEKFAINTNVRWFQMPGVENMTPYIPEGNTQTNDSPCMVYCHHVDGRITKFNPQENLKEYKPHASGNLAENMKETLLAIESVDKKRDKLEKKLDQYEYLLKQVNIAATLYRQFVNSLETGSRPKFTNKDYVCPVPCSFRARLPEGENYDHIFIDCEISNEISQSLSCDWSVMVTVDSTNSNEDSITRSLKLNKELNHSQSLTLTVPISPKLILFEMEVTVSLVLQVTLKDNFLESSNRNERVGIVVPVHHETIDVLYFIHGDKPELSNINLGRLKSNLVGDQLMEIAKTRPSGCILLDSRTQREQKSVCITAAVNLNRYMINGVPKQYDSSIILDYLLENTRVSQIRPAENGCFRTFLGQPVYLNVTVNQSGESGGESTLVTVSIRSDLATAAAVHKAIQHRLQLLSTDFSVPALCIENVRRKLYHLQDLETELTKLQTERQCENDIGMLATVYEKMRKITLLTS